MDRRLATEEEMEFLGGDDFFNPSDQQFLTDVVGGATTPAASAPSPYPNFITGLGGVQRPIDLLTGLVYQTEVGGAPMLGWYGGQLGIRNGIVYEGDTPAFGLSGTQMLRALPSEYGPSLTYPGQEPFQNYVQAALAGWSPPAPAPSPPEQQLPQLSPEAQAALSRSGALENRVGDVQLFRGDDIQTFRKIGESGSTYGGKQITYQAYDAYGTPGEIFTVDESGLEQGLKIAGQQALSLAGPAGLGAAFGAALGIPAQYASTFGNAVLSSLASGNVNPLAMAGLDVAGLGDLKTAAQIVNAAKSGDFLGAITGGMNLAGISDIAGFSVQDISAANKIATALNQGDIAGLISAANHFANSPELTVASSATKLLNAASTGNPIAIANAAFGLSDSVTQYGNTKANEAALAAAFGDQGQASRVEEGTQAAIDAAVAGVPARGAVDTSTAAVDQALIDDILRQSTPATVAPVTQADVEAIINEDVRRQSVYDATAQPSLDQAAQAARAAGYSTFTWQGKEYSMGQGAAGAGAAGVQQTATQGVSPDTLQRIGAAPQNLFQGQAINVFSKLYPNQDLKWVDNALLNAAGAFVRAYGEDGFQQILNQSIASGRPISEFAPPDDVKVWNLDDVLKFERDTGNKWDPPPGHRWAAPGETPDRYAYTQNGQAVGAKIVLGTTASRLTEEQTRAIEEEQRGTEFYGTSTPEEQQDIAGAEGTQTAGAGARTVADIVRPITATAAKGLGEQIGLAGTVGELLGFRDNVLSQTGADLQSYGKSITSREVLQQQDNFIKEIANADGAVGKLTALGSAIWNNPKGVLDLVGSEAWQELTPLGAATFIGRGVTAASKLKFGEELASKYGVRSAIGANGAFEAGEAAAASYQSVYDKLKDLGYTDEYASNNALKSAVAAGIVELVASSLSEGPLVSALVSKVPTKIGKATGAEAIGEYVSGGGQNLIEQVGIYGSVRDFNDLLTAATVESAIGGATTASIATGQNITTRLDEREAGPGAAGGAAPTGGAGTAPTGGAASAVVATDADGNPVTVNDLLAITGTQPSDATASNVSQSVVGVDEDGNQVTVGDVLGTSGTAPVLVDNVVIGQDESGNDVTLADLGLTSSVVDTGGTTVSATTGTTAGAGAATGTGAVPTTRETGTTAESATTAKTDAVTGSTTGAASGTGATVTTGTAAGAATGAVTGAETAAGTVAKAGTAAGAGTTTGTAAGAATGAAAGTTTGTVQTSTQTASQVTATDVSNIVNAAIAANPQLNVSDVQNVVNATLAANPGLKINDVNNAVSSALSKLPASVSPAEMKTAINAAVSDIQKTQITQADVKTIVDSALAANPGLKIDDVRKVVSDTFAANPNLKIDDVNNAISAALQKLPASVTPDQMKSAIDTAVSSIQKTQLSRNDVSKIVSDALAANPGLKPADVQSAIDNAISKIPPGLSIADVNAAVSQAIKGLPASVTSQQVQDTVTGALKDYATKADIDKAIAGITFPQGITKVDVANAVKEYMAANPGLSFADVAANITDATKNLATTADVKQSIADSLKGYATSKDIQDAIAGIKFPAGLSQADVTAAIKDYMAANPGVTSADMTAAITQYMKDNPPLNIKDVNKAIEASGKTVQTQMQNLEKSILDEVKANEDRGLSRDQALSTAINKVADAQKVSANTLLEKLGNLDTSFGKEISGLRGEISKTQDAILEQVAKNEAAGLDRDSALDKAIQDVAKSQNVLESKLREQLVNLQTDIGDRLEQFTSSLESKFSSSVQTAIDVGLKGDAALQAAIDNLASETGQSKEQLLSKLGQTEEQLKKTFADELSVVETEISGVKKNLSDAISDARKEGLEGDKALQSAIDKLADQTGQTKQELLNQLGKTEKQLASDFSKQLTGVGERIGQLETDLTQAIKDAQSKGLQGDQALQAAIDAVAKQSGLNKNELLSEIGKSQKGLETKLTGLEKNLQASVQKAIDSGVKGNAALQAGLDSLASDLGVTRENLLSQLGATETSLRTDFANKIGGLEKTFDEKLKSGLSDLGMSFIEQLQTQLGDVTNTFNDSIKAAQEIGLKGDEAIRAALQDVANKTGQDIAGVLSQLGTTEEALRFELATQIGGVQTQLEELGTSLSDAIADAKASGLAGDAALQKGLDTVAESLGTTRADLLSQLGTTEQALRTEFAEQIGGVQTQVTQLGQDLQAAIADARAAGLQGDQALQAGLDSLASDLGVTRSDLLAQLGTTEQGLRSEFSAQIGGVQTKLGELGTSLSEAIADAKAAGMKGDAALQAGLDSLASDLGVTRADLLVQLGTTEQNLKTQFAEQIGGVQTQVEQLGQNLNQAIADARESGLQGDIALQKAIDQVAEQTNQSREQVLKQLGKTEQNLRTELNTELTGVRSLVAQTTEQTQQRINELVQQGKTYQQANEQAFKELAQQQTQNTNQLQNQITELVNQGQTYQQATQTALQNIRQTQTDTANFLSGRIDELVARGEAYQAAVKKAFDELGKQQKSDIASVKKDIDDLAKQGQSYQTATQNALTNIGKQAAAYQKQTQQAFGDIQISQFLNALMAEERAKEEEPYEVARIPVESPFGTVYDVLNAMYEQPVSEQELMNIVRG